MMKALLSLFVVLIGYADLPAQDSTLVTVKAGEKIEDVLKSSDIYFYPQFVYSKILFKDGKVADPYMNYNRLYDQMLFISEKGDTLALTDVKNIEFIVNDWDVFYYSGGYLRLIADDTIIKLAEKQVWAVADVRKMGTHNTPTNTVAITSVGYFSNGQDAAKSKELILNAETLLRKETQYYFGDQYGHFVRASKKRLLNLFPKDERKVENYLNENKVNFDKKDDLLKLCQFLHQLH
ncbi:MAG TPA: hypothetical protein VHQ93_18790 [Chitinophagaceae bacterium]|jgi:hypothetical protein|nr:hypothetical protein [Chitinophagaceae bacterium]